MINNLVPIAINFFPYVYTDFSIGQNKQVSATEEDEENEENKTEEYSRMAESDILSLMMREVYDPILNVYDIIERYGLDYSVASRILEKYKEVYEQIQNPTQQAPNNPPERLDYKI